MRSILTTGDETIKKRMFQCMGVRDGVSLYKPLNLSAYLDYKHVHIHMHIYWSFTAKIHQQPVENNFNDFIAPHPPPPHPPFSFSLSHECHTECPYWDQVLWNNTNSNSSFGGGNYKIKQNHPAPLPNIWVLTLVLMGLPKHVWTCSEVNCMQLAFIPWSWPKQDVMLQVYFNTMLGLPQNVLP